MQQLQDSRFQEAQTLAEGDGGAEPLPKAKAKAKAKATPKTKARAKAKSKAASVETKLQPDRNRTGYSECGKFVLGCSSCRWGVLGCGTCLRPSFKGKRWHRVACEGSD